MMYEVIKQDAHEDTVQLEQTCVWTIVEDDLQTWAELIRDMEPSGCLWICSREMDHMVEEVN
jgi:hypothetical protein